MAECLNCGKDDAKHFHNNKPFCNNSCAREFTDARKIISTIGTVAITASELTNVEQSENELIRDLTHEECIIRLTAYKRQMQELRAREAITHRRINKLIALGEGEKTERYRKLGVNSDLEAKKKIHSTLQKSIIQYRKMGMDDTKIRNMMIKDLEFEQEKVDLAFKEL